MTREDRGQRKGMTGEGKEEKTEEREKRKGLRRGEERRGKG